MTSPAVDLDRRIVLGDRYTLVRQMATGGMAEIFLARQKALAGFEKDVVIKLLRDRYRTDRRVVDMFLNEARIGAVLNHPNIVHVYDVGEHAGTPYIAMELIQGEELSQLCRRGLELARFLPLEHAVDLVRQAAEGMGYFHAKRSAEGQHLSIVHRDISPSNLLVTQDGVLKIIDFGIAKADWPNDKRDPEDEKLVPGKYNYMSPEQVRGERVDQRSDVFSLGIVLYEITVGKRLFKGRPEEVIQKITRGRIKPPTFLRRAFPAGLETIIMHALELHRDDRYATAYELAGALEQFLREAQHKSGPVRIARYLDDLHHAEGGERRPELIVAGESWLDDDGEEALDFERGYSQVMRDPSSPPVPAEPAPAVIGTPLEAKKADPLDDDLTSVATEAVKAGAAAIQKAKAESMDEEMTHVQDTVIDDDLGEDAPTHDAAFPLPAPLGALPDTPATPKVAAPRVPVALPIPATATPAAKAPGRTTGPSPAIVTPAPLPAAPTVGAGTPITSESAEKTRPKKDGKRDSGAAQEARRGPPDEARSPLDDVGPGPETRREKSKDKGRPSRERPAEHGPTGAAISASSADVVGPISVPLDEILAASDRKAKRSRPIDLMLPEAESTTFAIGQGMMAKRRAFPWLLVVGVLVVLALIILLIARG